MENETYTSYQLFGIFFLREQLHNYLDLLEANYFELTHGLELRKIIGLLNSKRVMLIEAEIQFRKCNAVLIEDPSLFYPPHKSWLNAAVMTNTNSNFVLDALLTFNKKVMAWCYLILVDKDIGLELSEFLLRMIECAKADADYLFSVKYKTS